jgi:hypothetical protein
MNIEVSTGEVLDKLSILEIKSENIIEEIKVKNIIKELTYIKNISINLLSNQDINSIYIQLKEVNTKLWVIEDTIRLKEKNKIFDTEFIELARQVYITNDIRANLKKQINTITDSHFVEEKSYETY